MKLLSDKSDFKNEVLDNQGLPIAIALGFIAGIFMAQPLGISLFHYGLCGDAATGGICPKKDLDKSWGLGLWTKP
ncbi:MAG: hypothetical protein VX798_13250 [Bacteroidota bacterium]|nr:hypothetical protein [Bacteroidota bacterium]